MSELEELSGASDSVRALILQWARNSVKAEHIGGALSVSDILTASFFYKKYYSPDVRIILSKGHASLALYACNSFFGNDAQLSESTQRLNSRFHPGHPVRSNGNPRSVEVSTGSLGNGVSFAAGLALKLAKYDGGSGVIAVIGDGESNEGVVWEAFRFILNHCLTNITVIVDYNGLQQTGLTDEVSLKNFSLYGALAGAGFDVINLDGHEPMKLLNELKKSKIKRPRVIIAKTDKSYGLTPMKNLNHYHHTKLQG